MTPGRARMRPFVLLMVVATALVYASAGGGVDEGVELAAAGEDPVVPTAPNRAVPLVPPVPDVETSGSAPSDIESENPNGAAIDDQPATVEDGGGDVADDVYPVRVRVPGIDVDAAVVALGLAEDGTLEVPTEFDVTGWYTGRSVPGDTGTSVVVGHVDSHTGPAVFFELSQLEVGDLIQIDRSDGLVAWFQISELALVEKDGFPTQRVYSDTAKPSLRLITCGGEFDHSARSYLGNLIVFADHLGNSTAGVTDRDSPSSTPSQVSV